MRLYHYISRLTALCATLSLVGAPILNVYAQNQTRINELRAQIQNRNSAIEQLEQEIATYQQQLQSVSAERKTLQNELDEINISLKKLNADLSVTQQKIGAIDLTIQQLDLEIEESQNLIDQNKSAIAEGIRKIDESDSQTLVEAMLANESLSVVWEELDRIQQFQFSLRRNVEELSALKEEVEAQKANQSIARGELVSLSNQLSDKRALIAETQAEQQSLVNATKSEEAAYQKILAEKERQRKQFQQELFQIESQLKIAIDPSRLPSAGTNVLAWPLDNVVLTQRFGATVDAKRLYVSGTHNGIDMGTPRGTAVKAAASGVVEGVGNTDLQSGCYSYGKWVLLKHDNGLSTLYAHLDLIKATPGDTVTVGNIIGYSGNTGYSTGPHLHFTVYATQGVRVQQYSTSVNCKNVHIPIADSKAYLDPLEYLPAL